MSKDALAGVYTAMLEEEGFQDQIAENPALLDNWDLTEEEKAVLIEEAQSDVAGFAIGAGPVMGYLGRGGPPLSPTVASQLGRAINRSAGLPVGALDGPGFLSNAACCPWGHGVVGGFTSQV